MLDHGSWWRRLAGAAVWMAVVLAAHGKGEFRPAEIWLDTEDKPIQAHGGGLLAHEGRYYWYGEDRTPGARNAVACYSSTNLYDWKREGVVLLRDGLERV